MSKKQKIIVIVFLGILLISLGLYIAGNLYYTDARIYEENWKISLPEGLKKQYGAKEDDPRGKVCRYTIFVLKEKDAPFLKGASSQKNILMQNDVIEILRILRVDKQKYPNFSHDYKWKILYRDSNNIDKLYIIYDMESSFVYFLQDLL